MGFFYIGVSNFINKFTIKIFRKVCEIGKSLNFTFCRPFVKSPLQNYCFENWSTHEKDAKKSKYIVKKSRILFKPLMTFRIRPLSLGVVEGAENIFKIFWPPILSSENILAFFFKPLMTSPKLIL